MVFYIYLLTNVVNGKKYIGQTNNLKQRYAQYKNVAKYGSGKNYVDRALFKYGIDNFTFEHIASCVDLNAANDTEIILIAQYGTISRAKGYNIEEGGRNAPHTPETRQKISSGLNKYYETHDGHLKGKKLPEEWKRNVSIGSMGKAGTNKGKKFSDEWKNKMSKSLVGKECLKNRKFDPNIEQEICQLYLVGLGTQKLAKKFGCYKSVIIAILDRGNIKRRVNPAAKNASQVRRRFSDEQELEICNLYLTTQITMATLSKKYSCNANVIRAILLRNNINLKRH